MFPSPLTDLLILKQLQHDLWKKTAVLLVVLLTVQQCKHMLKMDGNLN